MIPPKLLKDLGNNLLFYFYALIFMCISFCGCEANSVHEKKNILKDFENELFRKLYKQEKIKQILVFERIKNGDKWFTLNKKKEFRFNKEGYLKYYSDGYNYYNYTYNFHSIDSVIKFKDSFLGEILFEYEEENNFCVTKMELKKEYPKSCFSTILTDSSFILNGSLFKKEIVLDHSNRVSKVYKHYFDKPVFFLEKPYFRSNSWVHFFFLNRFYQPNKTNQITYSYQYENGRLSFIEEKINQVISGQIFFTDGLIDSVLNYVNDEIFSVEKYEYKKF